MSRIRFLPYLTMALSGLFDLVLAILTFPEKVLHAIGSMLDFLTPEPQMLASAGLIMRTSADQRCLPKGVHRFAQPSNRLNDDDDDDDAIDNGLRRVGSGPRLRC